VESLQNWLGRIRGVLDFPILKLGETQITVWTVICFIVLLIALFYFAGKVRKILVNRVLTRSRLDLGAQQAVGSITRYVVLLVGLVIILQTVGINLTTLNVVAGAVGIGIGFGLQNIASNFVSGLIILFERPIKIGDRIEVGGVEGDVVSVGARSTTVVTNDNIAIIVPNSKVVTENVINWSYTDPTVRFKIPISVGYGSDVRLVEKLLLEVAKESPDVLEDPAPGVRFLAFGSSGLNFELRAWSRSLVHRKGKFISGLNFAIHDKFRQHQIEIPYPQLDLRIRDGSLEVKQSSSQ
jgi:small-conductance mechanosensitive channel